MDGDDAISIVDELLIHRELFVGELTREFEDFVFWNGMIGKECSFLPLLLSKRYAEQDEKDGE